MASEKNTPKQPKRPLGDGIYNSIADTGHYLFGILIALLGNIKRGMITLTEKVENRFGTFGSIIKRFFGRIGRSIALPFIRYAKAIKLGGVNVSSSYRDKGAGAAINAALRMAGRILFGKRGLVGTLFNWALPIVTSVFLFNIISYATNMTYALSLNINGDFVGYVADETVFTDAEKMVQQRINYMDSTTETVTFEPSYKIEMLGYGSTLTKYQLADKMLASMGADIEYGYGMYIGSSFYGALVDKTKIEATLDELLDVYRTGVDGEKVAFENQITYEPGLYLKESIVSEDSIINLITSKKSVAAYYTAVEGDSPIGICTKLGMTYDEIAVLNPGFSEKSSIYVGDKFLINQEEPFLDVTVTRTEIFDESTDYETVYYDDSTHYQGAQTVTQDGEYGTDRVTAEVSYINGVVVRKKVLKRVTIQAPVEKIVALGTKPIPPNTVISNQQVEVGQMYWPLANNAGQISEMMYGYGGYDGHDGIDIAAPYGTPIIAAESGTVILSQWYYGYGYCVMIQHPNNTVTVYGHCSYLHVNVGEQVTQGQQIADVGSTGQSTGNHLHFEVRVNGYCLNPINYLPWHVRAPWCVEW